MSQVLILGTSEITENHFLRQFWFIWTRLTFNHYVEEYIALLQVIEEYLYLVTDGELSGGVRNVQEPIAAGSGSVTEEVRTISQTTLITHLSPISPSSHSSDIPNLQPPSIPPLSAI